MIRGVYRNGVIYPADPVPAEWRDGQTVEVEAAGAEVGPSDDPAAIDRWDAEWRAFGPVRYEAGEQERVRAAMAEADAIAKAQMRERMGLNGTGH